MRDISRTVLLICMSMGLGAGLVLAQDSDGAIYFPGHTNTKSIHTVQAEINRNSVLSFIREPTQVDIPRPTTNPFLYPIDQSAGPTFTSSGRPANGLPAHQQRPEQNIRPIQQINHIGSQSSPGQQEFLSGNRGTQEPTYQSNAVRPIVDKVYQQTFQAPSTNLQTPEVPFQNEQYSVFSQVQRPSGQATSSINGQPGFVASQPVHSTVDTGTIQRPNQNSPPRQPSESNGPVSPYVSFAYQLFVNANSGPSNLVISPILTQAALALLQYGAEGQTRQDLGRIIQTPLGSISYLIKSLKETNSQQTVIEYVSTMFINNESKINRTFATVAAEAKTDVALVNFRENRQAVHVINSWVSQATRGAISAILDQNADTRHLEMLLANAIYFRSAWKYKFDASNRDFFYKAQADRKAVTFIKAKQYFPNGFLPANGPSGGVHWVEVPYAGEEFSMVFLVPRFRDTLLSLISELSPSHVQTIINQLGSPTRQLVDLKIPKFDIETRTSLLGPLRDMGLGRLFASPSELVYINERQQAAVGDCIHNAKLTVDETGTIAAAANAFSIIPLSISSDPEMSFVVDQPFLVMIVDTRNNYPLFVAQIFDP